MKRLLALLAVLGCGDAEPRPPSYRDLHDEVQSGRVTLIATGNGSSSGAAIYADLESAEDAPIRTTTLLARPMYLVNRGRGQDMIALQVFMRDGSYTSDGRESFITLSPGAKTRVLLLAYCADFDKDNPTASEQFAVGAIPAGLIDVVDTIHAYIAAHPDADATSAIQAAIWLAQGIRIRTIRSRFSLTEADEELAMRLSGQRI